MSEPSPATKVVANLQGTTIQADSAHGAAAVKKISHPPTTLPVEYCGYPDDSSANVVLMEVKGVTNVAPILTFPTSASATSTVNTPEIMFLSPNGGQVASYVFLKLSSPPAGVQGGWVQPVTVPSSATNPAINNINNPAVNNVGYNWLNFLTDVSQFRTCYKSQTFYLNSTDFNNQGEVTTASFKPSILQGLSYTQVKSKHPTCTKSIKSLNDAVTAYTRAKGLKSEEFEMIDAYPSEYTFQVLEVDRPDAYIAPIPNSSNCMYIHHNVLCDTMSDVMNMSSKAATRPAREGSFEVQGPTGPIMEWNVPGAGAGTLAPAPAFSGPIISIVRSRVGNTFYYFPLLSAPITSVASSAQAFSGDVPWNNLDWKISIWSGLTMPASTGTTLSSVPYITVKSFAGLEIQPQFNSSLRPFQKSRCPPDDKARRILTTIFHERPDSLPAAANDLASIASTAVKFLPTAVSWLKDLFGSKKQSDSAVDKAKKFVGAKKPTAQRPQWQKGYSNYAPPRDHKREIQQAANAAANRVASMSLNRQTLPTVTGQPKPPPNANAKRAPSRTGTRQPRSRVRRTN